MACGDQRLRHNPQLLERRMEGLWSLWHSCSLIYLVITIFIQRLSACRIPYHSTGPCIGIGGFKIYFTNKRKRSKPSFLDEVSLLYTFLRLAVNDFAASINVLAWSLRSISCSLCGKSYQELSTCYSSGDAKSRNGAWSDQKWLLQAEI